MDIQLRRIEEIEKNRKYLDSIIEKHGTNYLEDCYTSTNTIMKLAKRIDLLEKEIIKLKEK